ncbi:MAG: DUF4197 domain-containing protein [Bacteroidetes bacterium]|nr:DUF4197 domain-containing protein [Bacteroidota bacterium]
MYRTILTIICALLIGTTQVNAQGFGKFLKKVEETVKGDGASDLTEGEVVSGLKEALMIGVEKGVDQLSQPDGYFKNLEIKIPLPPEAQVVEDKLRKIGLDKQVDDAIESLNRAAEDAVVGAKDIFINAIKQMTVTDAMSILRGDQDAATKFLERTTRPALVEKFQPTVKVSLDKVGATKYWNTVFTTYNKVPFVEDVNPDLEVYATNKAIDGLFHQIAKQEAEIRKNPGARVTDLLKKVFGS